jgi:hypothetical protein
MGGVDRNIGSHLGARGYSAAEDYRGSAGISAADISERERRRRYRKERKRMRREWKELARRQQELRTRELYMCPEEVNMQRAALRASVSGRHRRRDSDYDFDQFAAGGSTDLIKRSTPLKRFTRPQIIGGILYHCECAKRNGLQDACRIALCQGRPECLTNPPMCLPSGGLGYKIPNCPFCNTPVTCEPYEPEYDRY